MNQLISKLLSLSSAAISNAAAQDDFLMELRNRGPRFRELVELLAQKNGFYAFEAALHVLPHVATSSRPDVVGVESWNTNSLWKDVYQGLLDNRFCFAEDVFGMQFAIEGGKIVVFNPETGELESLADSFEDWAGKLLLSYSQLTGWPIAHAWQLTHGPIPGGKRLVPKVPFILGGKYEVENLHAIDAVKGMRYRGELWEQLRDLPDGAQVQLKALPLQ